MAYEAHTVLAVVPARSGSRGIPHKNLQILEGRTLIAWAADVLAQAEWIDTRIISTDSPSYAQEARRHGLEAPFLRPAALSGDTAGAVETLQHALIECERARGIRYDVILVLEPTSPLRLEADLRACTELLVRSGADSVVTVSPLDEKYHPFKVLSLVEPWLRYYDPQGDRITHRQQLGPLYYRNGVCYALTRPCLLEKSRVITDRTLPLVITRPVANIDTAADLEWARHLLSQRQRAAN